MLIFFKIWFTDNLNACLILSQFLPRSKKSYDHEEAMSPFPDTDDFFQVVPVSAYFSCVLEYFSLKTPLFYLLFCFSDWFQCG